MKHFDIKNGEWPSTLNKIMPVISAFQPPDRAALVGVDVPGLRPRFEVEEGASVSEGQVLFRDRKHPEVAFVSPLAGRVSTLAYGPRKTLSACIITASPEITGSELSKPPDRTAPRVALLERGFWPAFRTRPFGRMPAPDASPAAIFVNAVQAEPQVADPSVVLAGQEEAFHVGISALSQLTEGRVFVCQSPGTPLVAEDRRVVPVSFGGSLAAGLASTHVDRLNPGTLAREIWTIGYQDVAAIGHLFQTGEYRSERVVAIGGPAAVQPRLVRTCLGAALAELCKDDTAEVLSGGALTGRRAAFLGRFDDQVTLVTPPKPPMKRRWLERFGKGSSALIPTRALERALAVDIPPVPLMRALAVGDSEAAERLGVLALIEEDVAALARHCTSGADYPHLLRQVLDNLRDGAA